MRETTASPNESPFLIVGVGSSGSTLLSILLDRHPLIACGPELSVFNKSRIYGDMKRFQKMLPIWLDRGLSTNGLAEYREFFFNLEAYFWTKSELVDLANDSDNLRDFFDRFYARYLKKRKKSLWGEKTGTNAYCTPEFLKLYPKAKIIHIVRDGRDMVCSMMRRPRNSAYHCVSHWLFDVSAAAAFRNRNEYLEVRYEDLSMDPQNQLERICHHLGVEFELDMMKPSNDDYWKRFSTGNVHDSWKESPFSGKISNRSIGRYRVDMDKDVEALFWQTHLTAIGRKKLQVSHRTTFELMKMFGYSKEPPTACGKVRATHYSQSVREGWIRAKREILFEHRLVLPLLWVWIRPGNTASE
jgi:sulfotransferase family protein